MVSVAETNTDPHPVCPLVLIWWNTVSVTFSSRLAVLTTRFIPKWVGAMAASRPPQVVTLLVPPKPTRLPVYVSYSGLRLNIRSFVPILAVTAQALLKEAQPTGTASTRRRLKGSSRCLSALQTNGVRMGEALEEPVT